MEPIALKFPAVHLISPFLRLQASFRDFFHAETSSVRIHQPG